MSGSVGQPTQCWMPFVGVKSSVGTPGRSNDSLMLAMGRWDLGAGAQNDEWTVDLYLDSVTWKFAMVHMQQNDAGIYGIQLDGASQGTVDGYAAGTTRNVYSEITSISVATAGVKTFKSITATKNASSTNYRQFWNSAAWIATSGTHATPGGSDTPGYTVEIIAWMTRGKSVVGTWGHAQGSTTFGGGLGYNSSGAQNDEIVHDIWLDAGTFTFDLMHDGTGNRGIVTVQLDGSSQGTIDEYDGPGYSNAFSSLTGLAVTVGAKAFKMLVATKNAASTGYYITTASAKWIRTGA